METRPREILEHGQKKQKNKKSRPRFTSPSYRRCAWMRLSRGIWLATINTDRHVDSDRGTHSKNITRARRNAVKINYHAQGKPDKSETASRKYFPWKCNYCSFASSIVISAAAKFSRDKVRIAFFSVDNGIIADARYTVCACRYLTFRAEYIRLV